jgi:tRNA (adenine57-N1/adenine58-N1)-methyltransferase
LLRQALAQADAPFGLAETQEIMRRTWHVEARSVRPDHRMVGHTGFLTTARRIEAGQAESFNALKADEEDGPAEGE